MGNVLTGLPADLPEELIEVLVDHPHVRIERIVSMGHESPEGFWYDQAEHEWVVVLRGEARLLFENNRQVHLAVGDHIMIAAHEKHRVQWTSPVEPTVWLAIFY